MQCKQNKISVQIKKLKIDLQKEGAMNFLTTLLNLRCCQEIIKASGPIRERIYTPFQIIRSFIKQILDADHSCSNAVISLAAERLNEGKKAISLNTGPYVRARKRLSEETPRALVKAVWEESLKRVNKAWMPFGREVKLADGTTVQMPDTKANSKEFPKHANKKKHIGFPVARIVAVMSLTTGSVVDYEIAACKGKGTGEITLLRNLLSSIKENDLLVADRLYCNFF
ncbi:transposase, partial [Legionella fallonii]|uniref:Transposase n=1 Tax=Legionella fallonii LLAP-10 TaxID=1212491 RepID=A0A098G106_9GAMM